MRQEASARSAVKLVLQDAGQQSKQQVVPSQLVGLGVHDSELFGFPRPNQSVVEPLNKFCARFAFKSELVGVPYRAPLDLVA